MTLPVRFSLPDRGFASRGSVGSNPASPVIRASQISQYVFCRRAWWLAVVHGYQSVNQAALVGGIEAHTRHGKAVAALRRWQRGGYVLLGLGFLLGISILCRWLGVKP